MEEETRQTATKAIAAWFIDQYHAASLIEDIEAGRTEPTPWEPHIGHHAQAHANAEAILDSLRSLPVEDRMEAMGMEPNVSVMTGEPVCWHESAPLPAGREKPQ